MQDRKRAMVDGLRQLHLDRYQASGAELIMGEARFTGPRTVEVDLGPHGQRRIRGDRVFLNLGTRATVPGLPGLAAAAPMTHVELLDRDRLPEHLVVMGGGFVGLELVQAMRRFGSRVTVIEPGAQLAGGEDPDVAAALLQLFGDEGIEVLGCNETEARRRGIRYRLLTLPMAAVLRTRTLSEPRGFLKMVLAADSDEILGFTAFGAEASELMAAVQVAMIGQMPYTTLRTAIFTHPTAAEGLTFLLSGTPTTVPGR